MKKILLNLILLLKRLGFIIRGLALAFFASMIFLSAIPDLIFNLKTKEPPTFTEKQIIKSDKKELPLYLKISDVQAVNGVYVEELYYNKKTNDTTLNAILYPVYNLQVIKLVKEKVSPKILETFGVVIEDTCHIVVKDSKIKRKNIEDYFTNADAISIEGKYDQKLIDEETRRILTEEGYNIAPECIVLEKGSKPLGVGKSVAYILIFGILGLFIILSFLPTSMLYKILKKEEIIEIEE